MLVDFSDGMKLDEEPNPILVDLSDEKKPWMFTLDGLILFRTLAAGRRPHSILNAGRRPHSFPSERWTFYSGRSP